MARPPIDRGESDAVLELCRKKTETTYDIEYFYRYELDGEGRLKNLFWADTDSVIDDDDDGTMGYGDVVVFDTTCRTNKHGVHFVPFLGLSHHRTPVVLGCGVTSDQSVDSLVWLLRAFKESNDRRDGPESVITDASDAVAAAVKSVFPGSNHRFCSGHVEQGIEDHLRGSPAAQVEFMALMCDRACSPPATFQDRCNRFEEHHLRGSPAPAQTEFRALMRACYPETFQRRWNRFMAKHRTNANQSWLDAMYGKREMWAAALVRDKLFLGMANDQSTECLATALHRELREDMSLTDLWRHADACADALRGNVAVLDRHAAMSPPVLTGTEHGRLEEHAARLFTPANFYLVREEIKMMGTFDVTMYSTIPDAATGDVRFIYTVAFNQCRGVSFAVSFEGKNFHVFKRPGNVVRCTCTCRKMERDGLPCRHIFCVMRYTSMTEIPACCVLARMKKRTKRPLNMERLDEMKDLGRQVFDLASQDAQEFQDIKDFFQTWLEEKEGRQGSGAVADDDATDVESSTPVPKRIKLFDD